jgi:hypothetical protein
MLRVLLIVALLFLALNVAPVTRAREPTFSSLGVNAWMNEQTVFIKGTFRNDEDIGVYGSVTAKLENSVLSKTYTNTSRIYFPPQERIEVILSIKGLEYNDLSYLSQGVGLRMSVSMVVSNVDDINGAPIDGDEEEPTDSLPIDGDEEEPTDSLPNYRRPQREEITPSFPVDWTLIGVGVVAAVAITAVVVVKRKKMKESDLRKLSPDEFQKWVVKKLSVRASSLNDSRIGIDAYTAEGYPIQIKQSDNIGRRDIEKFAATMGRIKAKNGFVVAFSFADDVYRGIVGARINYRIEIRKITVTELIERGDRAL